jgi:transposase-like protein
VAASVDHAAILEALETGASQNAVARQLGCSVGLVNKVARVNGREYSRPKHAAEARRDYAQAERLALLNKLFDKVREMADGPLTPNGLQALTISMGILTDKRRLEDGEATSRAEIHGDDIRDRLASRLDELAARRRQKAGAG